MATPRKRPMSGFSSSPSEGGESEKEKVAEFLDTLVNEALEATEAEEEIKTVDELLPVVIEEIVPTEDPGPRFIKLGEPPSVEVEAPVNVEVKKPKRHPRNIPKFSRIVK